MLESIHVKNIALIDEVEIDLTKGFNILSGETGAGKSIIIDSVNFALGGRLPKDIVRENADYALCELVFTINDASRKLLDEEMIPIEDDRIVMQRKVMNGRNVCKVNGETVTTAFMKGLATELIDIHGQHEHQSLLYKKKHMEILDSYCGDKILKLLEKNKIDYDSYLKLSKELEEARLDDKDKNKEISLLEFESEEIRNANLIPGEDEELEASYTRMSNSKRILEAVGYAYNCTGYDSENGAGGNIGRAVSQLKMVSDLDPALEELLEVVMDIDNLVNELNRSLSDYMDDFNFTDEVFNEIEERLNLINHLKAKYGNTIEEINSYAEECEKKLEKYMDYDRYIAELEEKLKKEKEQVLSNCEKISDIRQKQAKVLAKEIIAALQDLNFPDVTFEIKVEKNIEKTSAKGFDDIEFMISMNPGEKVKPLTNVASGGELSRIMLALKAVLANKDDIGTLIFDEIDTGISGRTAQKVSEKLAYIAKLHQVICITHLPQIAAMADSHFEISKTVENNRTITNVIQLEGEEISKELARMLGGAEITDAVLGNACEMKKLADDFKQGL